MSIQNNNITIVPTSGYSPSFSWQVGVNSSSLSQSNIKFRATIRPLNGYEAYTRVPSPTVLYEETGLFINSSTHQGQWEFPLNTNASISGGPYRNYQVVIEAHDSNGNTSAGNMVGTNYESNWVAFNQGYDVLAVSNPRQTGIEMSNNLYTQYSSTTGNTGNLLDTGFYLHSGNGYSSLNYMGTHGEINIRYLGGNFNSNLVGGYIYAWTGRFTKLDTLLGINGFNQVSKSQFSFNPTLGYVYHPTAAMAFRGANYVYTSLSFYDNLDQEAIDNGIDISTGLYLSDNAICYNDIAAGSISIGGFSTIYSMSYTGNSPASGILGTGINILSEQSMSGSKYVLYLSQPNSLLTGIASYSGTFSILPGGRGGNSILINGLSSNVSINTLIPMMTSNILPYGVASASSSFAGFYPYYAFNPSYFWESSSASTPQWIQYQFTSPKIAKQYIIGTAYSPYYSPINYQFQGSNDGSTWITLDTQTSFNNSVVNISNTNSYSYYRIYITVIYVGGAAVTIQNFQIYGY